MAISVNIDAVFTPFERDIDSRTRDYFDDVFPWVINDYSLQQMQYLYKLYWAEHLEEISYDV